MTTKSQVTLTVDLDGTSKTFSAAIETDTAGHAVAKGAVYALHTEAIGWINDERGKSERGR